VKKTFLDCFVLFCFLNQSLNQLPKILPRKIKSFLWPELICLRLTAFPYSMWAISLKDTLSFILSGFLTALFYSGALTAQGQEELHSLLGWTSCNKKEAKWERSVFFTLLCSSGHTRANCSLAAKQTLVR